VYKFDKQFIPFINTFYNNTIYNTLVKKQKKNKKEARKLVLLKREKGLVI